MTNGSRDTGLANGMQNPVNLRGSLNEPPEEGSSESNQKQSPSAADDSERRSLEQLARSQSAPALSVARARALLAVGDGASYTPTRRHSNGLAVVNSDASGPTSAATRSADQEPVRATTPPPPTPVHGPMASFRSSDPLTLRHGGSNTEHDPQALHLERAREVLEHLDASMLCLVLADPTETFWNGLLTASPSG